MAQVPSGRPRHAAPPRRGRLLTGALAGLVGLGATTGALFATGVLPGAFTGGAAPTQGPPPAGSGAPSATGAAQGWLPEDASWVERAKAVPALASAKQVVVASSPLVLATGPEIRAALGTQPLAGDTLSNLITLDKTFGDYGKPEWGQFRLVLPDPAGSAVGALGYLTLTQLVGKGEAPPTDLGAATVN